MIVEQPTSEKRPNRLLHLTIGVVLAALCIWLVARDVDGAALREAVVSADPAFIALGTVFIILTGLLKSLRWRILYHPVQPNLIAAYRATMLGQMINMVSPIPRLGDVARIGDLHGSAGFGRAQSVGTMISEKSLDLISAALTLLAVLPLLLVRSLVARPTLTVALMATTAIGMSVALWLAAFRGAWLLRIFGRILTPFPATIADPLHKLAARILDGLTALGNRTALTWAIVLSVIIMFTQLATPWLLFYAFDALAHFGLVEATILHLALTVNISLPAPPGRLGVFEGITYATLTVLNVESEAVRLGYAILFHAVVLLPPLLIGAWVALTRAPRRKTVPDDA